MDLKVSRRIGPKRDCTRDGHGSKGVLQSVQIPGELCGIEGLVCLHKGFLDPGRNLVRGEEPVVGRGRSIVFSVHLRTITRLFKELRGGEEVINQEPETIIECVEGRERLL